MSNPKPLNEYSQECADNWWPFGNNHDPSLLRALRDAYRQGFERGAHLHNEGWIKISPPNPLKHKYVPDKKYPWFCDVCGYAEHETLKHCD